MVILIFDLETSGLNPYHDDIIEIGAKVINSDNCFNTLLKPKSNRLISRKITEITGISNKLLNDEGKAWLTAYTDFYNWLFELTNGDEQNVIVSHNGNTFDFIFLKRMLQELSKESAGNDKINIDDFIFIDTLLVSRRLLPDRSYYSQPTLAKSFRIQNNNAHRAMGDVIVLEGIYKKLLEILLSREKIDGVESPEKILDYINLKL